MNSELSMVEEFMQRHGHDTNLMLPNHVHVELQMISDRLMSFAAMLEQQIYHTADPRVMRAQLLCEELGELLAAMATSDELLLLDGLADLLYVTLGTALTFDLPVVSAFHEIHRSNMTKQGGDMRVRQKGDKYEQPDLESILMEHRMS